MFIGDKELEFDDGYDIIRARVGDQEVGCFQFMTQSYGEDGLKAIPEQMHIAEGYRGLGIGTEIIKHALECYDAVQFMYDYGNSGNSDLIHYTDAGLSFKQHCERMGITKEMEI
jgi:GNAT superfamily N-acetyltransferase